MARKRKSFVVGIRSINITKRCLIVGVGCSALWFLFLILSELNPSTFLCPYFSGLFFVLAFESFYDLYHYKKIGVAPSEEVQHDV